jgi:hypothetical protein
MPYASTVLGSAVNSIPNMIRNRSVARGAMQGMGLDALNQTGNAIDNYANTRRGFLPDLLHRMQPLRTGLGAVGNSLYRAVTGGDRTRMGIAQGGLDEAASRGMSHLGNVIKSTPVGGAINRGWNSFKGALGRGVDNVWDKLTGYTGARKEWSDMDKQKPIEETYGGDPLAKAHEELQNSFKQGGNPGTISPDTEALLSPAQRAQFNQVKDAKLQAHKDMIAQDRVANPGIVGNTATALGNMASNITAPVMTGVQRAREAAAGLGTTVRDRVREFGDRMRPAPQPEPQNTTRQDMSMDQTGLSDSDLDAAFSGDWLGNMQAQQQAQAAAPAPAPAPQAAPMPEPVQQAMDQSAFGAAHNNWMNPPNAPTDDPSSLSDANLDQIDFGNMFGSTPTQNQTQPQQPQQNQGWGGWAWNQAGRGLSALGGLFR